MSQPLLALVIAVLDRLGVRYALIGAGALAVHGVARSTFDLDLLTTNPAVLDPAVWAGLTADERVHVSVRRGDADDPVAGLVRVQAAGERDVDVVVGRWAWQTDAVERASPVLAGGLRLPVVAPADLILLKLHAGGSQDKWDIEQLLAGDDRQVLVDEVGSRVGCLPIEARRAWAQIVSGT
jgi:predicted nucleotidyltransferase